MAYRNANSKTINHMSSYNKEANFKLRKHSCGYIPLCYNFVEAHG